MPSAARTTAPDSLRDAEAPELSMAPTRTSRSLIGLPATDLLDELCKDAVTLGRSERTIAAYRFRLQGFLRTLARLHIDPCSASREDVVAYREDLGKTCGLATIKARLATVHVLYAFMTRRGWIEAPPLIELPRVRTNPPVHVLSTRQVFRILAQPDTSTLFGIRDRALLELLYSTGIRLGELLGLTLSAVDFHGGFLRVEHGKGDKWRVVPVGETALVWTQRYLEKVRPKLVSSGRQEGLFLSRFGRPPSPTAVQQWIARYAKAARIPWRVSPHGFRHSAATHLLRGDGKNKRAGIIEVRDILGHETADSTSHYTRVEITDLERELHRRHFRDRARRSPEG